VRRRVQGERGPAEHHQPRRLGRISGKKGERIVYIRTLVTSAKGLESGKSIDTVANTGQYL
jgi:proteasome-associated ATPase